MKSFMLTFAFAALLCLTACNQEEFSSSTSLPNQDVDLRAATTQVSLNYTPAIYLSIYNGDSSENPFWKCTDYILVDRLTDASCKAVYGVKDNAGGQVVFWYDANHKFIKADASKFVSEFTTPENAEYIRVNQHVQYPDVPLSILRYGTSDDKEIVPLFYEDAIYLSYYTGIATENPFWKCSQAINVQPDEIFYVNDNTGGQVIFWYSVSGGFIKLDESKTQTTFKAPAGAAFFKVNQHVAYKDVDLYKMSSSKNLIQRYFFCRSIDDNGNVTDNENCYWKYTNYILVNGGEQYNIVGCKGGVTIFWYENAPIANLIRKEDISSETILTAPSNAGYVRILQHTEYPDASFYKF